jgi:hypothetical protein
MRNKTQRAYLQFSDWQRPFLDPSHRVQLKALETNLGKLPAQNEITLVGMNFGPWPEDVRVENALFDEQKQFAKATGNKSLGIGEKVIVPVNSNDPVTDSEWADILSGKQLIYLLAITRYSDAASKKIHETAFCGFYWAKDPDVIHECHSGHFKTE